MAEVSNIRGQIRQQRANISQTRTNIQSQQLPQLTAQELRKQNENFNHWIST